jgi:N-acyl-D-amino-acid deacylase
MRWLMLAVVSLCFIGLLACPAERQYDLIIRNGLIYDGNGGEPFPGDVAVDGDTIVAVGDIGTARGKTEIDAKGLAVAPGFINIMSWASESLIADGRSQSDIRQGVTLEVFGEGWSMGPVSEAMKQGLPLMQADVTYDIEWSTLGEYLDYLAARGVSCNIASFIGATTCRLYVIGSEDRLATPEELERMKELVRQAMEEGAMGLSTALEYAPAIYADTHEIVELAKVSAQYDGIYISHMRSEGDQIFPALDEFFTIAREAGIRSEIYHLKVAGKENWPRVDEVLEKIEAARRGGLRITANMYPYTAGATMLSACLPPWALSGDQQAVTERIKDPAIRKKIIAALRGSEWKGFYYAAGPDGIMLTGFKKEELRPLIGKRLSEIARERGKSPEDTLLDLLLEDESPINAVYFLMNEEQVAKKLARPWVCLGSDEASLAPEGVFLHSNPHPRAYGTFARVLGKYVRDEKVIPLNEAIRRITTLPASTLKLERRGALKEGNFADIVVFDPEKIQDHATFEQPHQYSTGVVDVFVNGVQVLKDGEHTGAKPGRVVRGPGWKAPKSE